MRGRVGPQRKNSQGTYWIKIAISSKAEINKYSDYLEQRSKGSFGTDLFETRGARSCVNSLWFLCVWRAFRSPMTSVFFPHKKHRDFFLINTTYINHNFFHSLGRSRKYDLFTPRRVVYVVFRRKLNSISQAWKCLCFRGRLSTRGAQWVKRAREWAYTLTTK